MTLEWQKPRKSFPKSNALWGPQTGWNWINIAAGKMSQAITFLTNITFLLLSQVFRLSFITIMLIHHFCNKTHCTFSPSSSHGWANSRERAVCKIEFVTRLKFPQSFEILRAACFFEILQAAGFKGNFWETISKTTVPIQTYSIASPLERRPFAKILLRWSSPSLFHVLIFWSLSI